MAKRSVKKARMRTEDAPASAPAASRRQFWLGVVVAAAVLIPLAVVGVVIASGGDDAQAEPAASGEVDAAMKKAIESEAAELRRQTGVRDKEQVAELTNRMRAGVDTLQPVLDGLAKTLPPGEEKIGPLVTPGTVAGWRVTVQEEKKYFDDPPSGETGTNVARGGFAAALGALNEAVETYAIAVHDPGSRRQLLARAREQRDLAVRSWSVAATQLDAINIATGYGHQHVFLGASADSGGLTADPAPEGSGAEDGE